MNNKEFQDIKCVVYNSLKDRIRTEKFFKKVKFPFLVYVGCLIFFQFMDFFFPNLTFKILTCFFFSLVSIILFILFWRDRIAFRRLNFKK